jgi:hypothetical protein
MITYFKLPPNYNFKVDVKNTRLRNNQKYYVKYLLQTNPHGNNRVDQYLNANLTQIVKGDIPSIFNYINNISGYIAIQFDPKNLLADVSSSSSSSSSSSAVYVFNIRYNDLIKQQQIKELRNKAKLKRVSFDKEDIAKRIWQYRYLPPDPRSKFFERNDQETTKFREIPAVPEFTRSSYVDPSVDLSKKKVKPPNR